MGLRCVSLCRPLNSPHSIPVSLRPSLSHLSPSLLPNEVMLTLNDGSSNLHTVPLQIAAQSQRPEGKQDPLLGNSVARLSSVSGEYTLSLPRLYILSLCIWQCFEVCPVITHTHNGYCSTLHRVSPPWLNDPNNLSDRCMRSTSVAPPPQTPRPARGPAVLHGLHL